MAEGVKEFEDGWLRRATALGAALLGETAGPRLAWATLASLLVAAGLLLTIIPGPAVRTYPMDFLFVIDQGWRLANGQVPNLDFVTPIGPVYYGLVWLGNAFFGAGPDAAMLLGWLAVVPAAPALLWLALRRMPPAPATAFAVCLALVVMAPRPLDGMMLDHAFLAVYNSLGWLLLALVGMALLPPVRPSGPRTRWAEAAILACGAGAAVMLKLTTGAAACLMLAAALLPKETRGLAWRAALILAAAAALTALAVPHWLAAYLDDNATIAAANDLGRRLTARGARWWDASTVAILTACGFFWLLDRLRQSGMPTWGVVAFGAAAAAGAANGLNNHESHPIWLLMPFLLGHVAWVRAAAARDEAPARRRGRAVLSAAPFLLLAGWNVLHGGLSLPLHAAASFAGRPAWDAGFMPATARELRMIGFGRNFPEGAMDIPTYFRTLADGAELVRAAGPAAQDLLVLDFSCAVAWLAGVRPAPGVLAWLDPERTYSVRGHPDADRMLARVGAVLVPKRPAYADIAGTFNAIYGEALAARFPVVRENDSWILRLPADGR